MSKTYKHLKYNESEIQAQSAVEDGAGKNIENNYAKQDGFYENMTVGLAENLESPTGINQITDFSFRTSAGDTSIASGRALLNYIEGNAIEPTHTAESITPDVVTGTLTVTVNDATFKTQISTAGTYAFTYDGTNWNYDSSAVNLADYGIEITEGTPAEGDEIDILFTAEDLGIMNIANPVKFVATGFNCFDKSSMVLEGYTIDSAGAVQALTGSYIAYVKAVGGLDDGYTIFDSNNGIVRAGYSANIPTSSTTGIDLTGATGDSGLTIIHFATDGYICIATTDIDKLCVHPQWSGYMNRIYANYVTSEIVIPTVAKDDSALPNASYGLPGITDNNVKVADKIDFVNKIYYKNIGHYAYSTENLTKVVNAGDAYIYDTNHIFYVLKDADKQEIALADSIIPDFTVNDFSTEEFISANISNMTAIASVNCSLSYGDNLKDKLRTDVLTVSPQTLSADEKAQVLNNLGINLSATQNPDGSYNLVMTTGN